jgi:hypothetical protein
MRKIGKIDRLQDTDEEKENVTAKTTVESGSAAQKEREGADQSAISSEQTEKQKQD